MDTLSEGSAEQFSTLASDAAPLTSQPLVLLSGNVNVSWTLIPADGFDVINELASIEIQIIAKTNSWVGLGFNQQFDEMTGSDVYAGWVFPNGTFHINDYLIGSEHKFGCANKGVCADVDQGCENNILTSSGSYTPPVEPETLGIMRLNFTRKLYTMDKCDYEIAAGNTNIIVATGKAAAGPGGISGHGPNHDAGVINFWNTPVSPLSAPITPAAPSVEIPAVEPSAIPEQEPAPYWTSPTHGPFAIPTVPFPPSTSTPTPVPATAPVNPPVSAPVTQAPSKPYHVINQGSSSPFAGYALNWTIESPTLATGSLIDANAIISVSIEAKTDSWVGFGWNSDEIMPNADVIIGLRMEDGKTINVDDYKIGPQKRLGCGTNGEPNGVCLDTTRGCANNVLSFSSDYIPAEAGAETGTLKVSFTRLLVTGDSPDCDFAIGTDPTSVVFAMGQPGAPLGKISGHGRGRHGSDTISFLPATVPTSPPNAPPTSAPSPITVPINPVPQEQTPAPVYRPTPDCKPPTASEYKHMMTALEGRFKLYWTLRSVEDRLHLAMVAEGTGWVGFGIATSTGDMVGSEAIIGWPGSVASYTLKARNVPNIIPNPSIPLMDYCAAQFVGEEGKTWTVVRATRGVTAGENSISMSGPTPAVIAYGPDHELKLIKHNPDNRERINVNFVSGNAAAAKADARKIAHGVLMFISWGVMLQFGAIFARYAKPLPNALWFKIHRVVQFAGFGISVAGFILAIVMTSPPHFDTTSGHAQVGLTVMILGVIQIAIAIFRPNPANVGQNKSVVRVLWEFSHWWIGRLSLLLAVVAIFLGLVSIRAPFGFTIAWSVIVGVSCAVIGGLELYRKFAIDRPQQAYEYVKLNPSDGLN